MPLSPPSAQNTPKPNIADHTVTCARVWAGVSSRPGSCRIILVVIVRQISSAGETRTTNTVIQPSGANTPRPIAIHTTNKTLSGMAFPALSRRRVATGG
ncbi:hypothetical protein MPHO_26100 [Mycolicibacterium phocaicum]|nr:hypothetical protein MPHO_26100 [Mycolicibacterium phocaicum]BCI83507.1 hypothetical protein MTY66_51320 [Mycolicibacterium sp. TY66]BCJ78849.1 hypothetical protein MTY81_02220 [Mycolicibacterium sp. TY81]GCA97441.1 hypothetical protein NCCNTM_10760 [Mycolicibacterium sp. NCC-Tsukiji]